MGVRKPLGGVVTRGIVETLIGSSIHPRVRHQFYVCVCVCSLHALWSRNPGLQTPSIARDPICACVFAQQETKLQLEVGSWCVEAVSWGVEVGSWGVDVVHGHVEVVHVEAGSRGVEAGS